MLKAFCDGCGIELILDDKTMKGCHEVFHGSDYPMHCNTCQAKEKKFSTWRQTRRTELEKKLDAESEVKKKEIFGEV